MGSKWIPSEIWINDMGLYNLVYNPVTIQFFHRVSASLTLIGTLLLSRHLWKNCSRLRIDLLHLYGSLVLQYSIGISTLLSICTPFMGCLHQAGFLTVLTSIIKLRHKIYKFI